MIRHDNQKQLRGGKCLFRTLQVIVHQLGKPRQELEAVAEIETMEGWMSYLSYTFQACLLSGGFTSSELDPSPSVSNQENARHAFLHTNPMEAITQIRLPQTTVVCVVWGLLEDL